MGGRVLVLLAVIIKVLTSMYSPHEGDDPLTISMWSRVTLDRAMVFKLQYLVIYVGRTEEP